MKKLIFFIADVEVYIYNLTGIIMPLLRLKWKAESNHIQQLLDEEHTQTTVIVPQINIE